MDNNAREMVRDALNRMRRNSPKEHDGLVTIHELGAAACEHLKSFSQWERFAYHACKAMLYLSLLLPDNEEVKRTVKEMCEEGPAGTQRIMRYLVNLTKDATLEDLQKTLRSPGHSILH